MKTTGKNKDFETKLRCAPTSIGAKKNIARIIKKTVVCAIVFSIGAGLWNLGNAITGTQFGIINILIGFYTLRIAWKVCKAVLYVVALVGLFLLLFC